ncbi:hypothetical protein PGTUg99_018668 [Puccinia graminis f. sp. tritici]|uniref:Uncharacterized protein n=1 Tax=Puccinia graminis f. sp. tritici TaxID=56615 RepID=A0A5B0MAN2_PUCGR|nr:hypothetical protein PGTUg99_018668 [Puccinia graminis f. sp. tritici]
MSLMLICVGCWVLPSWGLELRSSCLSQLLAYLQDIRSGPVVYPPTPLFSSILISSPPRLSAYPPIFSTISLLGDLDYLPLLDDGIRKLIVLCTGRAAILNSCPGLLNLPIFSLFPSSAKTACQSFFIVAGPDPVVYSPKNVPTDPVPFRSWSNPAIHLYPTSQQSSRLRRPQPDSRPSHSIDPSYSRPDPFLFNLSTNRPAKPSVFKGRLDSSTSTPSPALHPIATSLPSHFESNLKKPLLSIHFNAMVTTRSSKAQVSNETSFCPPQAPNGAPVTRSAIHSASTVSPTELHANKFMISGPARPFTPVNSPATKVPVPIHPSTMAPESSRAKEHVDPHLVQEGINFYPLQSRWSPAFTPSGGSFPPGLRSPDFVNPSSTDGSSDSESGSSHSSVSDGFSSGSESNSSAPASAPPSIPNSSAFPSPSSSDLQSVPPSEIFYANRPRPQPVATGSGNSYDDPMVVDDDSASDSRPDSIPFGPTTDWGSTQQAAPPANTVNPNPSAREMMDFDYTAIRDRLVGSNPYPFGTQVYREEDLLFLFQHVANNFIHLANKYPASTLGEIEDRIQFYQNLQWVFTADRQVFLATHCGYP